MANRRSEERRCPAASLTADLFVEVLARLPIKSVCSSKCVSRAWRNLISHPDHRRKLPQSLAGFLYSSTSRERFPIKALHFTNISGRGCPLIFPCFSFLPNHQHIVLLDYCNGLLLVRCWLGDDDFHYFVCNPATKMWVAVPDSSQAGKMRRARLGFDPAVSPHFHVVEFSEEEEDDEDPDSPSLFTGVEVYWSKTGEWIQRENGWGPYIMLIDGLCSSATATVFLNGCLHCLTFEPAIAVVDMEGKTWKKIALPDCMELGFIQKSQGHLHYANFERHGGVVWLVIYVLEDYESQEWVLKHSVTASCILGSTSFSSRDFEWIAIHPECNLIFYTVGWDKTLKSYDMDRQRVRVIRNLGHDSQPEYLPYVPLYSELEALHM